MPTLGPNLPLSQPDHRTGTPKSVSTSHGGFGRVLDDLAALVGFKSGETSRAHVADGADVAIELKDEGQQNSAETAIDAGPPGTLDGNNELDADEIQRYTLIADISLPDYRETSETLIAPGSIVRSEQDPSDGDSVVQVKAVQSKDGDRTEPITTVIQARLMDFILDPQTEQSDGGGRNSVGLVGAEISPHASLTLTRGAFPETGIRQSAKLPKSEAESGINVAKSATRLSSNYNTAGVMQSVTDKIVYPPNSADVSPSAASVIRLDGSARQNVRTAAPFELFGAEVPEVRVSIADPAKQRPFNQATSADQQLLSRGSAPTAGAPLQRSSGDTELAPLVPTLPTSQLTTSPSAVTTPQRGSEAQAIAETRSFLERTGNAAQIPTLDVAAKISGSQSEMQGYPSAVKSGPPLKGENRVDGIPAMPLTSAGPSLSVAEGPFQATQGERLSARIADVPARVGGTASLTRIVSPANEQTPTTPSIANPAPLVAAENLVSTSGLVSTDEPVPDQLRLEAAVAPPSTTPTTASTLSLGPLAKPAVQTVAEAAVQLKSGQTEIALAPEELGRVSIRMTQTDVGLVVLLTVERDDTQALLRRHASDLSDSLRAAGLGEAQIDFADRDDRKGEPTMRPSGSNAEFDPAEQDSTTLPPSQPASPGGIADRIDIRM